MTAEVAPDPRAEFFADWCRLLKLIEQEKRNGHAPGAPPSWAFYRDRRTEGTWDDYAQGQARWRGDERYLVAGHSENHQPTRTL